MTQFLAIAMANCAAILIMWGRPPACRLRCLWLRKGIENFVRSGGLPHIMRIAVKIASSTDTYTEDNRCNRQV